MEKSPCLGNQIMMVEVMPLPPRKSLEEWKDSWLRSLEENRIHCPGCVDQERQAQRWLSNILEIKSIRTPQEEEELILHRKKLLFLNDVYSKVCKKAAEKQLADLQARLAANRAGRPLLVIPAAPAAAVSTQHSAVEEDLYC